MTPRSFVLPLLHNFLHVLQVFLDEILLCTVSRGHILFDQPQLLWCRIRRFYKGAQDEHDLWVMRKCFHTVMMNLQWKTMHTQFWEYQEERSMNRTWLTVGGGICLDQSGWVERTTSNKWTTSSRQNIGSVARLHQCEYISKVLNKLSKMFSLFCC